MDLEKLQEKECDSMNNLKI